MLLQRILEANESFLRERPKLLDAAGEPFLVIACIDPRLTGLLEPALGLPRHRALVIRVAGNRVSSDPRDSVLRSAAAAVYLKQAGEILIVGHTDCALARFSAADAIDNFRKAGIARSAFGDEDLRAWFGAFPDVKTNVLESISNLRNWDILPRDVKIHGLVIDSESGELTVVRNGNEVHPPAEAVKPEPPEPPRVESAPAPPPPPPPQAEVAQASAAGPIVIGKPAPVWEPPKAGPSSMLDAALILRQVFLRERQNAHFQQQLQELTELIKKERNPARILPRLETMIKQYEDRYPDLPATLQYLKRAVDAKGGTVHFRELMSRILD